MSTVEPPVELRAGTSLAVDRWGQRVGAFMVVALALFPYAAVDVITGVPVFLAVALLWTAVGVVGFAVLLLVALWDALRSLAVRSRPPGVQEAELAEAFGIGAATVRVRPGDYGLSRERIEEIAGRFGYRFARKERSYRAALTFRSNTLPVAVEEVEIARLFGRGEPSIKVDLQGYRVSLVRTEEIARQHGYEPKERVNLPSGVRLGFRRRAARRGLLPRPTALVGLVFLWPFVVLGAYFFPKGQPVGAIAFLLLGMVIGYGIFRFLGNHGALSR
ncbi:MAG: hypothetical protein GEV03_15495 [Streptosporangiales bacterium]|nr:hypothetical protein [Streptosporangiales bacterium]